VCAVDHSGFRKVTVMFSWLHQHRGTGS
jgi:hypothetical protein